MKRGKTTASVCCSAWYFARLTVFYICSEYSALSRALLCDMSLHVVGWTPAVIKRLCNQSINQSRWVWSCAVYLGADDAI